MPSAATPWRSARCYFDIACRRIAHAVEQEERMPRLERAIAKVVRGQQLSMFGGAAA